jgi:hypothetical protein
VRSPASRAAIVLCVLTGLFGARVVGQVLVAFLGVTWLPAMDAWYSGLLPYPVLLPIQIAILLVQVVVDRHVWRGRGFFARPRAGAGRALQWAAWIYAFAMVVRYAIMRSHPIPIVFHWVLAAYLFTLGRFMAGSHHRESHAGPMFHRGQLVAVLSVALVLPSCTIVRYQLRGGLESPSAANTAPCNFKYSLEITSAFHTNTFGVRQSPRGQVEKMRNQYLRATDAVLRDRGCAVAYVDHADDATLTVRVQHLSRISALPQEWLTGLSFGVIPSWSTREAQYVYMFQNKETGKSHCYAVDTKTYNHVVLFPIVWISFFTANERRVYKDALTNFLGHF